MDNSENLIKEFVELVMTGEVSGISFNDWIKQTQGRTKPNTNEGRI